jgi:hypothetical protein
MNSGVVCRIIVMMVTVRHWCGLYDCCGGKCKTVGWSVCLFWAYGVIFGTSGIVMGSVTALVLWMGL